MKRLRFVIPIAPSGQARGRAVAFKDRSGTVRARIHKDTTQSKKEAQLSAMLAKYRPGAPFEGEIYLGVKAYFEVPGSKPKKFKAAAEAGEVRPQVKPDLSNIIKQIEDVMQGVFFKDDKQIAGYLPGTGKYYGSPARWEIELLARNEGGSNADQ